MSTLGKPHLSERGEAGIPPSGERGPSGPAAQPPRAGKADTH